MSNRRVRFGIFQISSHPAVCLQDRDLLKEPILPTDDEHSLTALARDLTQLQTCLGDVKAGYLKWQEERLERLLTWLITQPSQPDFVVFPECSIPFECLHVVRRYSTQSGITFFAGTHTPRIDKPSQSTYRKVLHVPSKGFKDLFKQPPTAVLPIVTPTETVLHRKSVPSIFERSDVHISHRRPVTIQYVPLGQPPISCSPLVCAEALRIGSWAKYPDVVVIVAYERNPGRFGPLIQALVAEKVPVAFANDGAFGGSGVFTGVDKRVGGWWSSSPNHGQLPVGDAYLEVEIDLDCTAVEVGVAAPAQTATLRRLSPIVAGNSQLLAVEGLIESAAAQQNTAALKAVRLDCPGVLAQAPLTSRRQNLLESLADNGNLTPDWVDVVSKHISLQPQLGLHDFETFLSDAVQRELATILERPESDELPSHLFGALAKISQSIRRRARSQSGVGGGADSVAPPIGRQNEIGQVLQFVGHDSASIMIVTGLEAIGKTTVIGAAVQQSTAHALTIDCFEGTSADAIFEYMLRATGRIPGGAAPREKFSIDDIADVLCDQEVIWFRDCHHLTEYGDWRTKALGAFFEALLEARKRTQCLLLFESRRALTLPEPLGTQILRRRIDGFREDDGIAFLSQQVRVAGGRVDSITQAERAEIVKLVSSHPGMLILCAHAAVRDGAGQVISDLKGRRGFFLGALRQLLKAIRLSSDSQRSLSLLLTCRLPITPGVLAAAIGAERSRRALRELVDACVVSRTKEEWVQVISLFSRLDLEFADIDEDTFKSFHRAASKFFESQTRSDDQRISYYSSIEANYHAALAGDQPPCNLSGMVDALAAAARTEFNAQHYERVVEMLAGVEPERLPEDLLALLARSYAWTEQFRESFEIATRVVKTNRTYVFLFTEACNAAIRSRNWEMAREALRRAEHLEPGFYQIHRFKGQLAEHDRRPDVAIEHYRAAIKASNRDPWPYFFLVRALIRRGLPESALDAATECRDALQSVSSRNFENALLSQELIALVLTGDEKAAANILKVLDRSDVESPEMVVIAAYVKAHLMEPASPRNPVATFDEAVARLNGHESKKAHVRAKIAMFRGKLRERSGDVRQAEKDHAEACRLDSHNVHMKECYLRVLRNIAKEAKDAGEALASESAARRASEVASDILFYVPNHAQAHNALQDLHYVYGIS